MIQIDGDRRRHPRIRLQQPCKIHDPVTGRYLTGTTIDLSTHGLLIDLPRLTHLRPGDRIHVGVAMKRRQGLLLAKEMVEAVIVRTLATVDDHTSLALRFTEAQASVPETDALRLAA